MQWRDDTTLPSRGLWLLHARDRRRRASFITIAMPGRAADKRYDLASLHSITSSARASTVVGISRPSALAVLRLIARLAPAPETRAVIVGSVRACLRRPFERPTGASW